MRILLLSLIVLWIAGASPAFSEVFNHAVHNSYLEGAACDTCHLEGAASIVPDLKVCLECHEQDFVDGVELPALDSHGPTWAFGHRVAAKSDAMDCSACHGQDLCLECHKAGFAAVHVGEVVAEAPLLVGRAGLVAFETGVLFVARNNFV